MSFELSYAQANEVFAKLRAEYDIYAPIITEIYDVLHNGKSVKEATLNLMTRGKKTEF